MIEERFYVEGLAHASYLFGADGEAAVVDPKRDVDDYIEAARKNGLKITGIFETHPHADFASGHVELHQRTGAPVYISHRAPVRYERSAVRDGDVVKVGGIEVLVLETPGHSPDSLSFVTRENGRVHSVYTGDTLFVGDVGRPDLRDADEKPAVLADALYDSLYNKLLKLPDETRVYPAHGAGSLCGRKINAKPFSTIGEERKSNWALQIKDRPEFTAKMQKDLPARPAYFKAAVQKNLEGLPPLGNLAPLQELTDAGLCAAAGEGAVVIDLRTAAEFGAGHFPGSINIGVGSALFSTWAGFVVAPGKAVALVTDTEENARRARLELARIGYDQVSGFIKSPALKAKQQLSQLSVCDLKAALSSDSPPQVLDVRTDAEWAANHIEGATHLPLPQLAARRSIVLTVDGPVAVVCGSGYRSSIAASLLQSMGVRKVQNVMGGMGAFLETRCPDFNAADLVFTGEEKCAAAA